MSAYRPVSAAEVVVSVSPPVTVAALHRVRRDAPAGAATAPYIFWGARPRAVSAAIVAAIPVPSVVILPARSSWRW
ncbi:hypothetical protein IMZ48_33535 [Candidatus Bathyarchaeota archaeon]|nr:hypothetical protein [Candidatus Bathyarchaeota archaeon]